MINQMTTLKDYQNLLSEVDEWFKSCLSKFPDEIACAKSCSECCRGLFDITLLDAALLNIGFQALSKEQKDLLTSKAIDWLERIRLIWPDFHPPFTLNHYSESDIESLMATDDTTPCILLGSNGECLLYLYRPMTCRLHGLPLVDISGKIMEEDWCTKNFNKIDPLKQKALQGSFIDILTREAMLGRNFTQEVLGEQLCELDTFILAAVLVDFYNFDWHKWYECYGMKLKHESAHIDIQ